MDWSRRSFALAAIDRWDGGGRFAPLDFLRG
jgi:hypothetical protein